MPHELLSIIQYELMQLKSDKIITKKWYHLSLVYELDFVGIYLPQDVFTHGQLYVAFSRVQSSSAVAVYINNKDGFTKNIVYQEVL